jgi:hypothetical protein
LFETSCPIALLPSLATAWINKAAARRGDGGGEAASENQWQWCS